jgi:hypothetical protein
MKTSISLDDQTLKIIDDYRRIQPKIPTLSEAIRQILVENTKVKEENTKLPNTVKFEDLTIHLRDPGEGRGGSCVINVPYTKIVETGLKNEDKIILWILPKT